MKNTNISNLEISSTLKVNQIIIPSIILEQSGIDAGCILGINLADNSELLLSNDTVTDNPWTTKISTNQSIHLPSEVFKKTGLKAGDVVVFMVNEQGWISVHKVDGKKIKSYSEPECDDRGMPIPPGWLAQAFVGHPNVIQFLNSGQQTAERIVELVAKTGSNISVFESILDFGCGCGRVLRELPKYTSAKLFGCDLHKDAIDWCSKNYNIAEFYYGTERPPLLINDGQIDLLYGVSVLTHLDESHQDDWLAEWHRIMRPGGIIIATFRAEDFVDNFIEPTNSDYAKQIYNDWKHDSKGFCFLSHREWEGMFEKFYSDAYHTKEYIHQHWGKYFQILELIDAGDFVKSNRQNVVVMRKRN